MFYDHIFITLFKLFLFQSVHPCSLHESSPPQLGLRPLLAPLKLNSDSTACRPITSDENPSPPPDTPAGLVPSLPFLSRIGSDNANHLFFTCLQIFFFELQYHQLHSVRLWIKTNIFSLVITCNRYYELLNYNF